ncbi:MAG: pseudouridine synthase, partial [Oscillospiraceae bacterium]
MKSYTINSNDCNRRIDNFLNKAVPLLPKTLMYKFIRLKKIKLNRKRCQPNDILKEGDILELYINDEFFGEQDKAEFLSAKSDLNIVYEDENIILLEKEVGLLCHSGNGGESDTLVDRLKSYLYKKGEYIPQNENSFSPSLCNRIDRNTTGIVIGAKNAQSLRIINEKIKENEI